MWPGDCEESDTRLGTASVGIAPVKLESRAGHLEAALRAALPARFSRSWGWSMWMQLFVQPGGFYLRLERPELMFDSGG
jgi:hypothetical protein